MSKEHKKNLRKSGDSPPKKAKVNNNTSKPDIIKYGVGFDVHRDTIAVCVAAQLITGNILEIRSHTFSAMPQGITEIMNFLRKYEPISYYLMECTGVYHLPLYHALKSTFPQRCDQVIAMNPLLLNRRITDLGRKTDQVDAQSLAFLTFYRTLLRPSYIGSMQFYRLREMVRIYHKTNRQCTSCKNRIHKVLHSINAKLSLDLNVEWTILLLDRLSIQKGTIGQIYHALVDECHREGRPCKVLEKQEDNIALFSEISLNSEDRFVLRSELGRLLNLQVIAARYLQRAEQFLIDDPHYLNAYKQLLLIPGMGSLAVMTVLLEVGDYTRFSNWKAFCKYCGTIPAISESGSHKSKGHINRYSNKNIRYMLTQSAGVIITRCDRSTDLGEIAYKCHKLRSMPYKKAVMKVANAVARHIFHVLINKVDYRSSFELDKKHAKQMEQRLRKKHSLLENNRTRALRRDIQNFVGDHYDLMDHSTRFQLTNGFFKMINKANHQDNQES